jgi:hypothetical protein
MDRDRLTQVRIAVEESLDVISAHAFVRDARSRRISEQQCRRWIVCAGRDDPSHADDHRRLLEDIGLPGAEFDGYHERAGVRFSLDLARGMALVPDAPVALGYTLVGAVMGPVVHGAVDLAIHHLYPDLVTDFFRLDVDAEAERVDRLFEAIGLLADDDHDDVVFGVSAGERGMAAVLDEALGLLDAPSASVQRFAV